MNSPASDPRTLVVTLRSDACFGATRLSTVADVDQCTMVDASGLPYIGGRLLKGLLVEEAANLLRAIGPDEGWEDAALRAFGAPGEAHEAGLFVGDAVLDPHLSSEIAASGMGVAAAALATRATTIVRTRTAIDPDTGVAADHTLRSTRLVRAGTTFYAPMNFEGHPLAKAPERVRALIAGAATLVRRGGMSRSRGWGGMTLRVPSHADALSPLAAHFGLALGDSE